jgi:hypothetical protein
MESNCFGMVSEYGTKIHKNDFLIIKIIVFV